MQKQIFCVLATESGTGFIFFAALLLHMSEFESMILQIILIHYSTST